MSLGRITIALRCGKSHHLPNANQANRSRMPPGENMDDFCTMLWSGMMALGWKLSKEGKKRFFTEFLPLLHNTKHEVLGKDDDNSWYLVYIGTKTASRGKGYAKALIEHVTRKVSSPPRTVQMTVDFLPQHIC